MSPLILKGEFYYISVLSIFLLLILIQLFSNGDVHREEKQTLAQDKTKVGGHEVDTSIAGGLRIWGQRAAESPTPPASARTPAERLREVWSEERGWPWCWCRALGVAAAALSALPRAIGASSTVLRRLGRRETQEERSQQQSVTAAAAAAALVRRSSPSSPAPRSPLQQLESMATALESRCPICLDTWDNAGYVMPCLHQFCFQCIQQWMESKPECPLCKRRVSSIIHSVRADNKFEEVVIPPPAEASLVAQPAGRARGHAATTGPRHHPAASAPSAAGPALVGGLQPEVWASLLRDHPTLIRPVLPWLRQELGRIHGLITRRRKWWKTSSPPPWASWGWMKIAWSSCCSFPWRTTQPPLCTSSSASRCSGAAGWPTACWAWRAPVLPWDRQAAPAAPRPSGSRQGTAGPGPEPSNNAAGASTDQVAGSSSAALQGGPGLPPSSLVQDPGNQEAPQEETPEAVPGPSTAEQGRDHPQRGPRRAPKRRAPTSQASSPAAKKRPPRRQH
eukprot:XP_027303524.1 uncharacterized protein LOC113840990 [Anas platyrhynchos]